MTTDGPDGVVGTADDGPVESVVLPGPDQRLGTPDDVTKTLSDFTREIKIVDVPEPGIQDGRNERRPAIDYRHHHLQGRARTTRSYSLTAFISTFA